MRGWPMSRPHRPRRRRPSFRVPSRSPAPVLVVSPMPICAVARARAARCSPPLPPARPCHVPWLAHVSPAPPSASAQLGAQLGAHRLEASGAPHEISASSALSSAPIASKPAELLTRFRRARRSARRPSPRSQRSSSRDLTRSQRAMSRAAGSRAAAWLRCQR
jgi:hypothetical protein